MERRKALITAGVVSGAVFAATVAIGLNVGLLSSGADENPVGDLQADDLVVADASASTSTSVPEPVTIVVDEYVTEPGATGVPATGAEGSDEVRRSGTGGDASLATTGAPSGPSVAPQPAPPPTFGDENDDHYDDDDDYEDEEREDEEEHEELEGHDDDD